MTVELSPAVLIIGGGPAGLRAAAELASHLRDGVLVVERESEAGGIPRHSDHPGYGIRDLGRFMTGPKYAAILRERATKAGATIMTNTMVTDWVGDRTVMATSPLGRVRISARVVILATGARERPRPARLIPGDRGSGIYTTGHLQNLVHLKHGTVGRRAVIVGSELVSWSAALTLRHVGCKTVLMTTEYPRSDSYFLFSWPGRLFFRTKIATRTRVTQIIGRPDVEGVEVENIDTGERRVVPCDTVILTGDWIPDNELARAAGLPVDAVSKGPAVDSALSTALAGVFAIGNMLHPVDTADIAALDGAAVSRHVRDYLEGAAAPKNYVDLVAGSPFRWVSPARVLDGVAPPRKRLLLWSDRFVAFPRVLIMDGDRVVASKRLLWPAAPGRVFRVPSSVLRNLPMNHGVFRITLDHVRAATEAK